MGYFSTFLQYDIFAVKPQIYLDGRMKKGSWFGFFVTLLCFLGYAVLGGYYLSEMISSSNVNVVQSTEKTTEYLFFNVTQEFASFTIALEDPDTYTEFIDETIYYPKAFFKVGRRDNTTGDFVWESKEIKIERCGLDDFGENYKNLLINKPIDNRYCIKDINQTLYGHFLQDNYSLFSIQLFKCRNNTENNNKCKSEREISRYLNGTFLSLFGESISINPSNYKEPTKKVLENYYTTVGQQYHREMHLFLRIVNIITDDGILFSSTHKKRYLTIEKSQDMFTLIPKDALVDIQIKLSNHSETYKRTYIKIQSVLADFGGATKVIYIFILLFSSLPTQTLYEKVIVNRLFKFSYSNHKEIITNIPSDESKDGENIFQEKLNRSGSINSIKDNLPKFRLAKIIQEKKKRNVYEFDNIDLLVKEVCCYNCYKNNKKLRNIQLLRKGIQFFKEKMDVIYIFRLINNYEIMKKSLAEEEEHSFDNPVLCYNKVKGIVKVDTKINNKIRRVGRIGLEVK